MFDINDEMISQLNEERALAHPLREFTPIDYSRYTTNNQGLYDQTTLDAIQANIDANAQAQQQTQVGQASNGSMFSDYGINYDVNGDGKVGIFEGLTPLSPIKSFFSGGKEALTALVGIGTHLPEAGQALWNYLGETGVKSGGNPFKNLGYITTDITDAALYPYALDSETRNRNLGNILGSAMAGDWRGSLGYAEDAASEAVHRMNENSFYIALDAVPFLGKPLSTVFKGSSKAAKAAKALDSKTAKIAQSTEKVRSAGEAMVKNKSGVSTSELVRAAETGDWTGIPQEAKNVTKQYSDVVNDTFKKYSPATWVEPEEMSVIQKYARDNNITYQEAERITKPYLDEANNARSVSGEVTTKYTPNKGLADDVRSIATIEDMPLEMPKAEQILRHDVTAMNQSPEVIEGLRKVLTPDEMYSLRNATGDEIYSYLKQNKGWTERQLSDNLYNAGIRGIDGATNKAFNAKKMGSYNVEKDTVKLDPKATDGQVLHEWSHKELKDILKLAEAGDSAAISELSEFRKAMGLAEDAKITNQVLEDFADKVKIFVDEGKLPEGALGEYIGKKYGIAEKIQKGGVDAGIKHLDELAKLGDNIAAQVSTGAKLFKNGDIFPITHGLAEVDKAANVDDLGRIMAGRFSTRAFGNASYEAIAKQIANPNDYINQLTKNYLDNSVKEILKRGYSGDIDIRPVNPKDAMYISRELLEDGTSSAKRALDSASSSPVKPDDIAIDKDFLKAFKEQYQMQQTNNPFGRTPLGDAYNLRKSTALASGGYLVGNLQTGAANALINSNIGLIDDVINATLTKGKLAKNLGVYRRDTFRNTNVTKLGKALQDVNLNTGGTLLQKADSAIQNTFAEIAAHAELRRKGIAPKNRLSTIESMEASKLGELINDVKLVSLINPTKTLAPSWINGAAGLVNPFWRWTDTAAQSSLHMLKRHPILANALLFDVMARVGYDQELQRRMNIGVELDRPFVSYKVNPKTGEAREMSMEYLPQMNTLKIASEMVDSLKGKGDYNPAGLLASGVPVLGAIALASQGLNKYGKPMYRDHKSMYDSVSIVNGKRYKLNPGTGMPEPVNPQLDEVFTALANETLGGISLFNKTLAPTAAWGLSKLTGQDYDYYLPYGQALFGSFARRGEAPNERVPFLVAGDPSRPRGEQEIGNMLRGIYESPYYPSSKLEQGIYNPSMLRGFYKGINRRDMREMNMLMNR